jgi:transposase
MARYKTYDYHQTRLIPISLDHQLLKGTLEHAIHVLVEHKMDLSLFDGRYKNDETGCPAYDPKVLLKVVLFTYSRGFVGSRRIEWLCANHVTCMALACMQCPDHSTIAAFVSSMKAEILSLFCDILLACEEQQLLGGTVFALDGLKLSSNASKEWSGTVKELQHKQAKLEAKITQLLAEHQHVDRQDRQGKSQDEGGRDAEMQAAERHHEGSRRAEPQDGVSPDDESYPEAPSKASQPEALHDTDRHNADSYEVEFPPEGMQRRPVATGTSSARTRPAPRSNGKQRFGVEHFTYDETTPGYRCPNGKLLRLNARAHRVRHRRYRRYIAAEQDCQGCQLWAKCLSQTRTKRKHLAIPVEAPVIKPKSRSQQMIAKIDTPEGRIQYRQRLAIVEPVFANIRTQKRLDHFTLRGKQKVDIQWMLSAMVHTVEKIAHYGEVA